MNSTPSLNDLYQHITTDYATNWKIIGRLLGLPDEQLDVIEAVYPTNVERCCNKMLEKWLKVDATACWGKMLAVIKSPVLSSASNKGDYHCIVVTCIIKPGMLASCGMPGLLKLLCS